MGRSDGFEIMDVSTDILNDPKFRRLQRQAPEHVAVGFTAYIAVIADSWKAGRRVTVQESWPVILPFDGAAVAALEDATLLDKSGSVPAKTWKGWFEPAKKRRDVTRARWERYNAKRAGTSTNDDAVTASPNGVTASLPRGDDAVTALPARAPSVRPSVRPSSSKNHSAREGAPTEKKNGQVSDALIRDEREMSEEERKAAVVARLEQLTGVRAQPAGVIDELPGSDPA